MTGVRDTDSEDTNGKACLLCPSCGSQTASLWAFGFCRGCWYVECGGDLAGDWELSVAPSVTISAAPLEDEKAWWA